MTKTKLHRAIREEIDAWRPLPVKEMVSVMMVVREAIYTEMKEHGRESFTWEEYTCCYPGALRAHPETLAHWMEEWEPILRKRYSC